MVLGQENSTTSSQFMEEVCWICKRERRVNVEGFFFLWNPHQECQFGLRMRKCGENQTWDSVCSKVRVGTGYCLIWLGVPLWIILQNEKLDFLHARIALVSCVAQDSMGHKDLQLVWVFLELHVAMVVAVAVGNHQLYACTIT